MLDTIRKKKGKKEYHIEMELWMLKKKGLKSIIIPFVDNGLDHAQKSNASCDVIYSCD